MSVCTEQNSLQNCIQNKHFSQNIVVCDQSSQFTLSNVKNWVSIKQIKIWINRSHQRKTLARLDQRLLADIGYNQAQARAEFTKPFWE